MPCQAACFLANEVSTVIQQPKAIHLLILPSEAAENPNNLPLEIYLHSRVMKLAQRIKEFQKQDVNAPYWEDQTMAIEAISVSRYIGKQNPELWIEKLLNLVVEDLSARHADDFRSKDAERYAALQIFEIFESNNGYHSEALLEAAIIVMDQFKKARIAGDIEFANASELLFARMVSSYGRFSRSNATVTRELIETLNEFSTTNGEELDDVGIAAVSKIRGILSLIIWQMQTPETPEFLGRVLFISDANDSAHVHQKIAMGAAIMAATPPPGKYPYKLLPMKKSLMQHYRFYQEMIQRISSKAQTEESQTLIAGLRLAAKTMMSYFETHDMLRAQ